MKDGVKGEGCATSELIVAPQFLIHTKRTASRLLLIMSSGSAQL
jgi:hypothetical protein